jgi:hypothetical protein
MIPVAVNWTVSPVSIAFGFAGLIFTAITPGGVTVTLVVAVKDP